MGLEKMMSNVDMFRPLRSSQVECLRYSRLIVLMQDNRLGSRWHITKDGPKNTDQVVWYFLD